MAAHENRVQALMLAWVRPLTTRRNIRRAPAWMQRCNLEWLYRLDAGPEAAFQNAIS